MIATLALGAALAAERFEDQVFYFGDLHVHTAASGDGVSGDVGQELGRQCSPDKDCGSVGQLGALAREAGLDFLAVADHVNGNPVGDAALFEEVLQQALALHDPAGGLVVVPAAEVHFTLEGAGELGHKNLYLFGDDEAIRGFGWEVARFAGDSSGLASCEEGFRWVRGIRDRFGPALLVPHHSAPTYPMPVDWSCHDPELQVAAEIYSHHGDSLSLESDFDPPLTGLTRTGTVEYAMNAYQLRMSFLGSTDDHRTLPGAVCDAVSGTYAGGLAALSLPEGQTLDRMHIHDAMVAGQIYATSGPRIPVAVDYLDGAARIGGPGEALPSVSGRLTAELRLPEDRAAAVIAAELVTPDGPLELAAREPGRWLLDFDASAAWVYPRVRLDGAALYGAGGCDDGGEDEEQRIWLSPSWPEPGPTWLALEPVPCGRGGAAWLPLAALLLIARPRR